jgi:hypothetical protein
MLIKKIKAQKSEHAGKNQDRISRSEGAHAGGDNSTISVVTIPP